MPQKLHYFKPTFVGLGESTDTAHQTLKDGEEHEDTDVVSHHPEHEHRHHDLTLRGGCYFPKFLNQINTTF